MRRLPSNARPPHAPQPGRGAAEISEAGRGACPGHGRRHGPPLHDGGQVGALVVVVGWMEPCQGQAEVRQHQLHSFQTELLIKGG